MFCLPIITDKYLFVSLLFIVHHLIPWSYDFLDICASVKTKIKSNYENLMKIRADAILAALFAEEVITLEEKQSIDAKTLNSDKMRYLIDTIIMQSLDMGIITKYKEFLKVLERNEDVSIKTVAQGLGKS